jgi:hypothetical protein
MCKTNSEHNNSQIFSGWKAYMIAKNRKQIALCTSHHDMLHAEKLIFKDKKIFDPNLL